MEIECYSRLPRHRELGVLLRILSRISAIFDEENLAVCHPNSITYTCATEIPAIYAELRYGLREPNDLNRDIGSTSQSRDLGTVRLQF